MQSLSTLFLPQRRQIGLLIPDVVTSESHTDVLTLTSHPVENGTNISDHAYLTSPTVKMDIGFSSGGSLVDFWDSRQLGVGQGLSPTEIYQNLLEMQKNRNLLDVVTGKRLYSNMLISHLNVTTAANSEHVLFASLTLTEVIIADTDNRSSAAKENMQQGVATSAVQNSGKKVTKQTSSLSLTGGG
ncbi:phage baseplate protein [Pantoea sp. MBD-2R]|uniref:phage baseplate protein n=1 Tax=Pantoea sp. MBD-2R TaxID=3141540 RepID=UPI0031842F56